MDPDNREVLERPGGTLIRYKPLPLKVERVYPWGAGEPGVKVEEPPR
jgi:hypothetical protein